MLKISVEKWELRNEARHGNTSGDCAQAQCHDGYGRGLHASVISRSAVPLQGVLAKGKETGYKLKVMVHLSDVLVAVNLITGLGPIGQALSEHFKKHSAV